MITERNFLICTCDSCGKLLFEDENCVFEDKDALKMAISYLKNSFIRNAYIAGFQACCNIIRKDMQECFNDEFLTKMEELADISYVDFEQ